VTDSLDDLVNADESAKGVLTYLLLTYREREEYIRSRVYRLWIVERLSLPRVQTEVESEIREMKPKIMVERADRMARLEDPINRHDAIMTEEDADLAAAMDRRDRARARADKARAEADAAEEANKSWFQKKKQSLSCWVGGSGKK
jgi:hypothetical protein